VTSRRELLDAEEIAWRGMWARFRSLGPDDWTRPGTGDPWSPKDVLAHIAAWHAEITAALEALRCRDDVTAWPPDVDAFNADAYERCKDMSLHDVEAMSGAARHRFREELAQAKDPLPDVMTARVACCGHEHYAEHVPQLEAFLSARQQA
jgi:DinB family protein